MCFVDIYNYIGKVTQILVENFQFSCTNSSGQNKKYGQIPHEKLQKN